MEKDLIFDIIKAVVDVGKIRGRWLSLGLDLIQTISCLQFC